MGASSETFSKREKEKQRQKKKQDKQEKREDRKANTIKGQGLDQMMAYVDEYGNITSTPPNPNRRSTVAQQDIAISTARREAEPPQDLIRRGTVTRFDSSKGYGFIQDGQSQQSVFVHQNELIDSVQQNDKVTFEIKMTPKGASAINVKKWVNEPTPAPAPAPAPTAVDEPTSQS